MAKIFKDMDEFMDMNFWIKDCIYNLKFDELKIILKYLGVLKEIEKTK